MKIFNIVLLGLSLTACLKPVYAQQACSCPKDKWCEHKPVWIPEEVFDEYKKYLFSVGVSNDIYAHDAFKISKNPSKQQAIIEGILSIDFADPAKNAYRLIHKSKALKIGGIVPSSQNFLTEKEIYQYDKYLAGMLHQVFNDFSASSDFSKHWHDAGTLAGRNYATTEDLLKEVAVSNPIFLQYIQQNPAKNPGYTEADLRIYESSKFCPSSSNDSWIYLVITSEVKTRNIFTNDPIEESIKTTMAHEMGHVFLVHAWPNLRDSNKLPAYVAHESFAVYTEYLYLKELAAKGHIAPFNIIDFIKDAANGAAGGTTQYTVSADYILCFLKGLDYSNHIEDAKGNIVDIPFDYSFLKRASDICGKLKNNQQVSDKDYKYKLVFEPAKYEYFLVLKKEDGTLFTTAQNLSDEAKEQLRQATEPGYLKGKLLKEEKSVMIDYRLAVGKENFLDESTEYMASVPPMGVDFPHHCEPWISMKLDPIKDSEAILQEKKKKMKAARKQIIQDVLNHLVNHNLQQCSKDDNIINIDSPHK